MDAVRLLPRWLSGPRLLQAQRWGSRRALVLLRSQQTPEEELRPGGPAFDDGTFSEISIVPRPLFRKSSIRIVPGVKSKLVLIALFLGWYASNTIFNIFNKQVLREFPFPVTCSTIQCFIAGCTMALLWLLRLKDTPPISVAVLRATVPLAVLHACGFTLTNMSLGKVSVAFTHTVKATEPFFSVALSPSILGEVPTWGKLLSLFPIVAGVALASATEASFDWNGFLSAMGSNLAFQSRNVLSKRFMGKKNLLDNVNLFAVMTIVAFTMMVPFAFFIDGRSIVTLLGAGHMAMPPMKLLRYLILGGITRCMDVLSSYMILNRVSPVSHSVGNCVKRAVVIGASVIFFKTAMSTLNMFGTAIALFGVLVYSLVVTACSQSKFGPENPMCRPVYELKFQDGAGI